MRLLHENDVAFNVVIACRQGSLEKHFGIGTEKSQSVGVVIACRQGSLEKPREWMLLLNKIASIV